jgi:Domain of unknown function (DUF4142)
MTEGLPPWQPTRSRETGPLVQQRPRAREALETLRSAGAGQAFERSYLEQQLGVLRCLVELHQSEASQSPDQELARFAVRTLVPVREELDAANALGSRYGLRSDTLRNSPQY